MTPFDLTLSPDPDARPIAGGTQLVDLMRLGVEAPDRLSDVRAASGLPATVEETDGGIRIGALATMAEVAAHPLAQRHPALVQSLRLAASPQIRNMGTIGGCILQRTRCSYFRDPGRACNRREPGSGCPAIGGDARGLAILGTSPHCIANYPGDLAVALVALGAGLTLRAIDGTERSVPVEGFRRPPGETPDIETELAPGELIVAVYVPHGDWTHSEYAKTRDRASYAFALASAAVAMRRDGDRIADIRIALGGLASVPWRCAGAEALARGRTIDEEAALEIGRACMAGADPTPDQRFKVELGARTVARALLDCAGP